MQLCQQPHPQAHGIAALVARMSALEDIVHHTRNLNESRSTLPEHSSFDANRPGPPSELRTSVISTVQHASGGNNIPDQALQRLTAHIDNLFPVALASIATSPGARSSQKLSLEDIVKGLNVHVSALEAFVNDVSESDMSSPLSMKVANHSRSQNIPRNSPSGPFKTQTQMNEQSETSCKQLCRVGSACEIDTKVIETNRGSSSDRTGISSKPTPHVSSGSKCAALLRKLSHLQLCLNSITPVECPSQANSTTDDKGLNITPPGWAQALQHRLNNAEERMAMHATQLHAVHDHIMHLGASAKCNEKSAGPVQVLRSLFAHESLPHLSLVP
jgi:hypothetical protein